MRDAVLETFLWLFGLCVGSFLNVVVYRLGIGLSVGKPARSFCPRCRASIAWRDNIPILSWILLRGRCRHCHAPISVQYPLVEALTGLAFVLTYHLLFVAGGRAELPNATLPGDLPLVLAWLALVACLVACAAMDIVSYTVDVRVTNIVVALGIILHALWPRGTFFGARAATPLAAGTLAAFAVTLLMLWWTAWRHPDEEEPPATEEAAEPGSQPARTANLASRLGVLGIVVVTGWLVAAAASSNSWSAGAAAWPVAAALLVMFAAIVLAGGQQRAVDEEIHAAIEDERHMARRMTWTELLWLSPIIVIGCGVWVATAVLPSAGDGWSQLVNASPGGAFVPLGGVVFAVHGAVVAAAVGWLLRIVFTLVYGREAFGIGDIYILAAAGATAGWDIALLGLLLSVGIALAGWVLGLLLKSTVMIPFGPWLALGFMAALWCNRSAQDVAANYSAGLAYAWQQRPQLLIIAAGLMLIGTAAAVVLSRVVRNWVAPDTEKEIE